MNTNKLSEKAINNARNMYSFTIGQKVIYLEGKYDYYFTTAAYKENGIKFYDIENPNGIKTPRVRENEMLSYN